MAAWRPNRSTAGGLESLRSDSCRRGSISGGKLPFVVGRREAYVRSKRHYAAATGRRFAAHSRRDRRGGESGLKHRYDAEENMEDVDILCSSYQYKSFGNSDAL